MTYADINMERRDLSGAPVDGTHLIERLKAANDGSRELDADIYEAMGFEVKRRAEWQGGRRFSRSYAFLRDSRWEAMAHLTTSLDDGMRLAASFNPAGAPYITLSTGGENTASVSFRPRENGFASAATLPLALCIAILLASEQGA